MQPLNLQGRPPGTRNRVGAGLVFRDMGSGPRPGDLSSRPDEDAVGAPPIGGTTTVQSERKKAPGKPKRRERSGANDNACEVRPALGSDPPPRNDRRPKIKSTLFERRATAHNSYAQTRTENWRREDRVVVGEIGSKIPKTHGRRGASRRQY